MKVIHLNTYDGNGGAARASYRLDTALKALGVDSQLYAYITLGKKGEISPLYTGERKRVLAIIKVLTERYLPGFYKKNIALPFSLQLLGNDIHRHPLIRSADIVHLHWINHGFLSPHSLQKLATLNKPIVWTMHDCNIFTGGCHVRLGCENYIDECGNCPLLKSSRDNDISHRTLLRKMHAYKFLNLNFISPSSWLGHDARQSSLLKNFPVNTIPNTLETDIFKPLDNIKAKESLGLSKDKFVILSGSMPSKNDLHKGAAYLIDTLNMWLAKYPKMKENTILMIFGNRSEKKKPEPFPISTLFLGTIDDDEKLAHAYAASDMFIIPSLDDNLPNTVMESMACGTPAVAFKTGGIPEMIDHKVNGYVAEYKNCEDLMEGIQWVYSHANKEYLSKQARQKVMDTFSEEVVALQHIELYKRILKNGS